MDNLVKTVVKSNSYSGEYQYLDQLWMYQATV